MTLRGVITTGLVLCTTLSASAAEFPHSPLIKSIEWAPTNTIVRRAKGSDRFPMAWADDDAQYTAWGDGNGFSRTPQKLSLGFSRVLGAATNFTAEDIRSPSGESLGDGHRGLKGCGMISVKGTLYMWAGNANHAGKESRLAWSRDHAKTWEWADWTFPEFGFISLVNFGRDNAGVREDYVYAVAHDGPTGYLPADRFILMRAPREKVRERAAYEFLALVEGDCDPVWTSDIAARGAVLADAGNCLRQQMTYCAPLKRYLWWQQRPNRALPRDMGDTRFEGGFRIFDAPEPWGPWTLVYDTARWDVGPGEMGSFPPKWMSADGRTLYLVFSGDDNFSVRKATLKLATPQP